MSDDSDDGDLFDPVPYEEYEDLQQALEERREITKQSLELVGELKELQNRYGTPGYHLVQFESVLEERREDLDSMYEKTEEIGELFARLEEKRGEGE